MAAAAAWRPSALTPAQREERRLVAARSFARGCRDLAGVARQLGVSRQSVSRWFATWTAAGRAGLKMRPKTGRRPEIDAVGWARLRPILSAGAMAAGFDTERWTLRRVAAVAERELGVRHHFRSYARILRAHGWTPQRPAVQAKERDDALVRAWLNLVEAGLARVDQRARREGRAVAFLDEAGHTFRARVGTTWAPAGRPPVLRRVSRRREVSSVVVVTAPLDGRPARLYARHFVGTVTTARLLATLPYFRRRVGRPLLLVWDRLNAHVAGRTQAWLAARAADYANAFLPGYAPELNPEEQCNRHAKHALLNALPGDAAELRAQARREFRRLGHRPDLLANFFAHAGLRVT